MLDASPNRRNDDRIAFRVPAHIRVGESQVVKGYVLNLSEHGAFVMMDDSRPLATDVHLRFSVPGATCAASGQVAHVMELGPAQGFGVALTIFNPEYQAFIRNLVSASNTELAELIRDMKRIDVRVGS